MKDADMRNILLEIKKKLLIKNKKPSRIEPEAEAEGTLFEAKFLKPKSEKKFPNPKFFRSIS